MHGTSQNELTPVEHAFIEAEALLRLKKAAILSPLQPLHVTRQDYAPDLEDEAEAAKILAPFAILRSLQADRATWASLHGIRLFQSGPLADEALLAEYVSRYREASHARLAWVAALAAV